MTDTTTGPGNKQRRSKAMRPLKLLVAALAIAAVIKELRMPKDQRSWHGVVAGFVLYVLTQVISDMGYSGAAPPAFASWLPAALAMLLSLTVLLYQEDG